MNLSTHFTLDEMTLSQTADRRSIDNTPPPSIVEALKKTALGLEGVRTLLGAPIVISSGYRSPLLNQVVGGTKNSQHTTGQAVDFIAPGYGSPAEIVRTIVKAGLAFDQCILEFDRWVHISFSDRPRRQALIIDRNGTRAFA